MSENRGSSVAIPATITENSERVSSPFDAVGEAAGRGSVCANALGANNRNAEASSLPVIMTVKRSVRVIIGAFLAGGVTPQRAANCGARFKPSSRLSPRLPC